MEKDIAQMKVAIIEIAEAIESGEREGLSNMIRTILGQEHLSREERATVGPRKKCDCGKCKAMERAENTPDDMIN